MSQPLFSKTLKSQAKVLSFAFEWLQGYFSRSFFLLVFLLQVSLLASDTPVQLLQKIDASYVWSYLEEEQKVQGLAASGARLQIPTPKALSSKAKVYFFKPYILVIAPSASSWWPLSPQSHDGWDLWVYAFLTNEWRLVAGAFPGSTLEWIHLFCLDDSCVCDLLVQDPENPLERQWQRYWVDWQSKQTRHSLIKKGRIDQILVYPNPLTGIFRYAYILEAGQYLFKYDILRSHERRLDLPYRAESMKLEVTDSLSREDQVILHLHTPLGEKKIQGLDLSELTPSKK